ncbi:sugar nucleotide-binding protein, partial [Pseudomonas syringae pv. actinidiae]|nr:sugar nucleotide-binding protein [Pseudomonas syringae pv. actinidiae]
RSKLMGEQAIQASGAKALVLRTSWVYAAKGNNFAKTILRLAAERDSLNVVADQYGAPTGAELIADVTAHILRRVLGDQDSAALAGIYHLAAAGETSWHGFARLVLEHAERNGVALKVSADKVGQLPPKRIHCRHRVRTIPGWLWVNLKPLFQLKMPPWQQGAQRMLDEIQR